MVMMIATMMMIVMLMVTVVIMITIVIVMRKRMMIIIVISAVRTMITFLLMETQGIRCHSSHEWVWEGGCRYGFFVANYGGLMKVKFRFTLNLHHSYHTFNGLNYLSNHKQPPPWSPHQSKNPKFRPRSTTRP